MTVSFHNNLSHVGYVGQCRSREIHAKTVVLSERMSINNNKGKHSVQSSVWLQCREVNFRGCSFPLVDFNNRGKLES